jgi:hypothetical protein
VSFGTEMVKRCSALFIFSSEVCIIFITPKQNLC